MDEYGIYRVEYSTGGCLRNWSKLFIYCPSDKWDSPLRKSEYVVEKSINSMRDIDEYDIESVQKIRDLNQKQFKIYDLGMN